MKIRSASVLAFVLCAACGGGGAQTRVGDSASDARRGGLVGNPAPDFSVPAMSGAKGTVSLESLRGKVVLLDFWGTFCGPCRKSFPKLQDLYAKYAASGLAIVGVSEDEADDKDQIPGFADTYGAKFVIGWDADRTIARGYKPETLPSTFLIDRNGVVRYAHDGYHDGEEVELEREIKELVDK